MSERWPETATPERLTQELEDEFAAAEPLHALERIAIELTRLRRHLRAEPRTLDQLAIITPDNNPEDIVADRGHPFRSVLIENPSPVTLFVGFGPATGTAARSTRRIPPGTARVIAETFEVVSIGAAPATLPTNGIEVYVARYGTPLTPTAFPLANEAATDLPVAGAERVVVGAAAVGLAVPQRATRARISVETAAIRFRDDGGDPTGGANGVGHAAEPGDVITVNPAQFRAIRRDAADAVIQASYYA